MHIIFFGNRDYWDIKNNGHTRYENIFKSLVKLNKHQIAYVRIFNCRRVIKHAFNYLKNIFRIKIVFSKWSFIIRQINSDKLIILSIYTTNKKGIILKLIDTIENLASIKSRNKWIWFNSPLLWDSIKNTYGYKYYFDSVELLHGVVEYKHLQNTLEKIYKDIAGKIQLLVTISEPGMKYYKKLNPNLFISLVKNGVNLKLFKPLKSNRRFIDQKVVGLVGNLNDNHEYSGLLSAAKKLNNIKFVIVGKRHGDSKLLKQSTKNNLDELFKLPNVIHYKWVPSKDLPRLINTFDVGLITYKTKKKISDNLLDTGDSLKKYQYLACNVPVISSDCQEVDKVLKKGIYTYYDEDEIKPLIEKVVHIKDEMDYRELVIDHDWDLIIKRILNIVQKN